MSNYRLQLKLACATMVVLLCGLASARAVVMPADTNYVEGDVLVRFHDLRTVAEAKALAGLHDCALARHYSWLSQHVGQSISLFHSENRSTDVLIAELRADPAIAIAEPNYRRHILAMHTPNDVDFGQLWGLNNTGQLVDGFPGTAGADIQFLKAWGLARPSTNEIVVGVIDTGLDITHPDIVSNLWTNPGEIAGNGIDDDGDGYADDVHGYDFALGTGALSDAADHGTHVAGTIAASGNNGIGVIGVDFTAHVMVLKASSDGEYINSGSEIEALQYAAMKKSAGVNIVALNASFGGSSYNSSELAAIQAVGDVGIILCAAAGNSTYNHDTTPQYPASYRLSNMIVVAATDQNDNLADFSDYGGTTVDIAAPGVNILSLLPLNLYGDDAYVRDTNLIAAAHRLIYSPPTTTNGITGALYDCGLGYPSDFPTGVNGNIALIQRGTLNFSEKIANAMNAGARAAVVFNNKVGNFTGNLGTSGNWMPCVSISQTDGKALQSTLPATVTVAVVPDPAVIYQLLQGTSMATPHVVGAVAFAALNCPGDTVARRIQRILAAAKPVPALSGLVITGGRLDLAGIVDADNNGLPDWWEQQYFGHATGTDPMADSDHDGASNLAEFLAGTNPTNSASALRLAAIGAPGGGLTIAWSSVSGHYYRLLRSTNLAAGFTAIVQTNIAARPPLNIFVDTPPASSRTTFYRVELEP